MEIESRPSRDSSTHFNSQTYKYIDTENEIHKNRGHEIKYIDFNKEKTVSSFVNR